MCLKPVGFVFLENIQVINNDITGKYRKKRIFLNREVVLDGGENIYEKFNYPVPDNKDVGF